MQLAHSMMGRRASTTMIPLTPAQIYLVRMLWRQTYVSQGPTVLGATIFYRLGFKSPTIKEALMSAQHVPIRYANQDSFVKAHYKAFADLVDSVITHLDNLDEVSADLERVGRTHAQMLCGDGLPKRLWTMLAETFIDCTLEWGDRRSRSETVRKAWALITAFMVEKMRYGQTEQRRVLQQQLAMSRSKMSV
jgi:hypothetical protein